MEDARAAGRGGRGGGGGSVSENGWHALFAILNILFALEDWVPRRVRVALAVWGWLWLAMATAGYVAGVLR